jgi:hypothetical protein
VRRLAVSVLGTKVNVADVSLMVMLVAPVSLLPRIFTAAAILRELGSVHTNGPSLIARLKTMPALLALLTSVALQIAVGGLR